MVRQGGYVVDLEINRVELGPGFGLQRVIGELEGAAGNGHVLQQQPRHCLVCLFFLRRLRLQEIDEAPDIKASLRIEIEVDHRAFDANFAEGPRPAQQAAGFEIHEDPARLHQRQAAFFCNRQVIGLEAEQKRIDAHIADRRLSTQVLLDQLRQLLPHQPRRADEAGQRVKQQ